MSMIKYGFNVLSLARLLLVTIVVTVVSAMPIAAATQERSAPAAAAKKAPAKPKGTWRLSVSKAAPFLISIKAADGSLTEIAAALGRKLKVPVNLSSLMQQQRVTVDFNGLGLDAALRVLAPQVYVDYEIGGDLSGQSKILAVYMTGLNEKPPVINAGVKGGAEAVLIEGNTEEGTEEYEKAKEKEESFLTVAYAKNQLTVRAKKQPLSVVLYKVASEMGVPFDLRYEGNEIVDVNFSNYAPDQAMRTISPLVRFYYRADLQTFEIQPIRIALVAPAKT